MPKKVRIAYQRYTSCGGCQLTLLNCERELSQLGMNCDFVEFPLVSSENDPLSPIDAALVEGSISSLEELERLLLLRRRATSLIAVGACAVSGGINLLAKEEESVKAEICGAKEVQTGSFKPLPLFHFVKIDASIYGCPPEGTDFLSLLGALQHGGFPREYAVPVCMECRLRENICLLLEEGYPCFGPVTRGGCLARCPSYGVSCEGCRGSVPEANFAEEIKLLQKIGLSEAEIGHRLKRFLRRDNEAY